MQIINGWINWIDPINIGEFSQRVIVSGANNTIDKLEITTSVSA